MFTNHIVLIKLGTLGVCKQTTFRCSISVTIFSVLTWDTFFAVYRDIKTSSLNTDILKINRDGYGRPLGSKGFQMYRKVSK